ncbi:MAG: hypothetical protein GXO79_09260 [Chlorobi bacterium]|nr:hypothetical protein [Chlorobiota bacterium]
MDKKACIYFGIISKTHGTSGEILLKTNLQLNEYKKLESVFIEINNRLIPFFIDNIRQQTETNFLISFDDIKTEASARKYIGCNIYILNSDIISTTRNSDKPNTDLNLIGYLVSDIYCGVLGPVKELINIPANPLISVIYSGKEILIPNRNEFIKEISHKEKVIYCELPNGFLSINSK